MKQAVKILGILLMLAGSLVMIWSPAWAQGPVRLRAVEPPEGRPGEELELVIKGGGFGEAQEVRVTIAGIEVRDAWVGSDEVIVAQIFIPEDAPPGPRPVEVIAVFGQNEEFLAGLRTGFFVLEREVPPPPGQPVLYEVSPQEVEQGSEAELTLLGKNFAPEMEVFIGGEGVEVYDWSVEDPSRLVVRIGVSPDAVLGPHPVAVETAGGRVELSDGLIVTEGPPPPGPAPAPAPQPRPGGASPWVLTGGALLVWVLGFTIGRALTLRTRLTWKQVAQLQWQLEAKTELPEPREPCTWTCKADATAKLLNRWKVTALQLTPLPVSGTPSQAGCRRCSRSTKRGGSH